MAHHLTAPPGPGDWSELPFRLVGLTGGIASGKSTVADRLAAYGLVLIDADVAAREVVEPGSDGLRAVHEAFGDTVLQPDGALDREALGQIVFADPDARARLGAILHPRIGQRTAALTAQARAQGHPMVIYDAPLIVENNLHRGMNLLVVVSVPVEVQRQRLTARDGVTDEDADKRIQSQLPLADKTAVADVVIDNSRERAHTFAQLHDLVAHQLAPRLWPDHRERADAWVQTRLDQMTAHLEDAR